jgi:hypothetical protein
MMKAAIFFENRSRRKRGGGGGISEFGAENAENLI